MMTVERPKRHPATIFEYLEKYGSTISIEQGRDHEATSRSDQVGRFTPSERAAVSRSLIRAGVRFISPMLDEHPCFACNLTEVFHGSSLG